MSLISSVPPNGTISGPLPNAAPQVATATVNAAGGAAEIAHALLPTAVIASNLVPAYAQESRNAKTALRVASNAPSSQLAAQYLAQAPDASDDELAIFTPRNQPSPQQEAPPEDAYLAALRTARGDVPQAAANGNAALATPPALPQSATQIANTNVLNFSASASAIATTPRAVPSADARGLPTVQQSALGRKPGLASSRGASAYQLAEARNQSSTFISAGVDSIL